MNKDINFPEDWLDFNFDELDTFQKEKVLQSINKDEFDELHRSYSFLMQTFAQPIEVPISVPDFRRVEKRKRVIWLPQIWKAAAILFIAALSFIAGRQLQIPMSNEISMHDTIYLHAGIDTVHYFDTVFLVKEKLVDSKIKSEPSFESRFVENNPGDTQFFGRNPLDELDHLKNKSKVLDLRDDSLIRNFSFVRI